jgi:3-hydroxyisobutyrate dehydrogenase-like beta-hydroxyacid dehydrogenase
MQVGFIGLGTMGAHMAACLQAAGHSLVVHDVRREAAERHIAAGAKWASTPSEVASSSDVIFSSLPGPPEVEAVALGPDGILAGVKAGAAWFDLSTNSPALARRLNGEFAAKGVEMLECPVSGGPRRAASGKLAIWVGGDEPTFERYRELLNALGDQVLYIGPSGSALVAKLVHNCTSYSVNMIIAEIFTMGVKAGVDPLTLWKAVRQGGVGRARIFDRVTRNFLIGKYDPPAFALRLAHKDVSLATMLGRELNVPMRMANLTLAEMTEAMARGWGEKDSRIPMLLPQERVGVKIEIDPKKIEEVMSQDMPKNA